MVQVGRGLYHKMGAPWPCWNLLFVCTLPCTACLECYWAWKETIILLSPPPPPHPHSPPPSVSEGPLFLSLLAI